MRRNYLLSLFALALTALTVQGGCIFWPDVVKRVVELVATGTVCEEIPAVGIINSHNDEGFVDIRGELDIQQVLSDAGIDVSKVDSVAVAGVTYRTTQLDPNDARTINNGQITVQRGTGTGASFVPVGSAVVLVSGFTQVVNQATTPRTAPVSAAGVQLINTLLQEYLAEAKGGPPISNTVIRYHVTGGSSPSNVATNFRYQICVKVNLKGEVAVDVVE
jgi:hypothetical protein